MTALAARLDELSIEPSELAALVHRPVEEVEGWIKAKTLGGEAAVLCRVLADADDAQRRVAQLRRRYHRTYAGGDAAALSPAAVTVGPPVRDGARYGVAS